MKGIWGFMKGSDLTKPYVKLTNSNLLKNIEASLEKIAEDPSKLTFLVEESNHITKKYLAFHEDIKIQLIVDVNCLQANMEKGGVEFCRFRYYRFIKQYNLYRYNRVFNDHDSPIYDVIEYLTSLVWEEELESLTSKSKTCTQADYTNENELLSKEILLRSKINHIFAKDVAFLTTEDAHLLARYKNDFLPNTLVFFKQLSDTSRELHRSEVMNQFIRIEEKLDALEIRINQRKERALLKQLHIMNQNH